MVDEPGSVLVRPPFLSRWGLPAVAAGTAVAFVSVRELWMAPLVLFVVVVASMQFRVQIVASNAGLMVRNFARFEFLSWADVSTFATKGSSLFAVTSEEVFVLLEAAEFRGVRRSTRERRLAALLHQLNSVRPAEE